MGEIVDSENESIPNIVAQHNSVDADAENSHHTTVGFPDHHKSSVSLVSDDSSSMGLPPSYDTHSVGSIDVEPTSLPNDVRPSLAGLIEVRNHEEAPCRSFFHNADDEEPLPINSNHYESAPASTGLPLPDSQSIGPTYSNDIPSTGLPVTSITPVVVNAPPPLLDMGDVDQDSILLLEKRSFRPFKTAEDYLYAMREDLAEWLRSLYGVDIDVDNFFEVLENGVLLCEHANNVKKAADEFEAKNGSGRRQSSSSNSGGQSGRRFSSRYVVPLYEVTYRKDSAPGSFFARDNVHNFIRWCRDLGVHDVLMFETDDLVLRKNEKHVILALLEIARRGARFGMPAPLLVVMEEDIDKEIEKDRLATEDDERRKKKVLLGGQEECEESMWEGKAESSSNVEPPNLIYGPQPQVVTNDLRSLDDMVRDLVARCTCPSQFPMIKVSEGKYRIGETKVLIFVRILRNHVMVRVGGGWDTLHHYLDKHDPCRCRSGHRAANLQKIGFRTQNDGDRQLKSVTYERNEEGYPGSPLSRRRSNGFRSSSEGQNSIRQRSQSPAIKKEYSPITSSPRLGQRGHSADDYGNNSDMWNDSSSEISDDGHSRKFSKRLSSSSDRHHSSLTQLSMKSSSASEDDLRIQPTPRKSLTNKPFSSTPKTSSSSIPRTSTSKTRSSSFDNSLPKNYRDLMEARRQGGKATMGLRNSDAYSKKNSIPESTEDRKISRSNSAISEGGFQSMLQKNVKGRQSLRGGTYSFNSSPNNGKNTWSGRSRSRNNTALHPDAFRPPTGVRSVRSASSSPAPTRKNYISSAPSTPANRSPKRRNNNSGTFSPPLPPEILSKLPNVNGDPDTEILAQLEGFVNSYRAYVLDKLASEGRSLPPDLSDKEWDKENDTQRDIPKQGTLKATPRKAGIGSRIPAPVF